jgi:hypothetical protein
VTRFAPIISSGAVADSLLAHLRLWLPTYLAEMDRQAPLAGGIATSQVRSWEIVPALDLSDEPQMPAIKIVTPGPSEMPVSDGEGRFRATYEPRTKALRDRYEAAIVACVMEKRSLGDANVRGTDYKGAWKFDLAANERRTKQAVSCGFAIEYENAVTWKAGPTVPIIPDDPINQGPPSDPTQPIPDFGTVRDPASDPPYTPVTITLIEEES